MLKLEEQVISLDLSKRLKELGFEQESLFYWRTSSTSDSLAHLTYGLLDTKFSIYYSAYTCAELGEMLPQYIEVQVGIFYLRIEKENIYWKCGYAKFDSKNFLFGEQSLTEAEARAKMLIYLKENGLC